MQLDDLKRAYQSGSGKTDAIEDALEAVFGTPNPEADTFFFSIIDRYRPEDRTFWIKQAIMYTSKAVDRQAGQKKLEDILEHLDRYWNLGPLLGTVATQLGRVASYPNSTLGKTIEFGGVGETEADQMIVKIVRSTAYGAYIATATDFHTGRDAGNEVESRDIRPTLSMAEEFISGASARA